MKKNFKRTLAVVMAAVLMVTMLGVPSGVDAAKKGKIKLSDANVTVTKGKTKKVTIKNVKENQVSKLTIKVDKKGKGIVSVTKSGKTALKVKGKKSGKAQVTVSVILKGKKKAATLGLKVNVKAAKASSGKKSGKKKSTKDDDDDDDEEDDDDDADQGSSKTKATPKPTQAPEPDDDDEDPEPEDTTPIQNPGGTTPQTQTPGGMTPQTQEPGEATQTQEPGDTTQTQEPGDTTQTQEPGEVTQTPEPGETMSTQKPGETTQTPKPGEPFASKTPTRVPRPTRTPKPTKVPTPNPWAFYTPVPQNQKAKDMILKYTDDVQSDETPYGGKLTEAGKIEFCNAREGYTLNWYEDFDILKYDRIVIKLNARNRAMMDYGDNGELYSGKVGLSSTDEDVFGAYSDGFITQYETDGTTKGRLVFLNYIDGMTEEMGGISPIAEKTYKTDAYKDGYLIEYKIPDDISKTNWWSPEDVSDYCDCINFQLADKDGYDNFYVEEIQLLTDKTAPGTEATSTPRPTRTPKPPTALPKNSAVEAHKLGKSEEVKINGRVDKLANGIEWENTTDAEIDLLANKEVSLRGTSTITAATAALMWDAGEKIGSWGWNWTGENALYAIVKVTKPGTPGRSDKVTLFISEDGKAVQKVEAVVGADATENGAAAVSRADDIGGVDGYIAELKIPLSGAYADMDKLNIDIMITDGDATINYFDTMTEFELARDVDGNAIVDENNRNIAVPCGPDVSVDKDASKMGDVTLIDSMSVAARAYYTGSGAVIREIADYEKNKWDWEIPATPAEGEEAEEPTDNGLKSKAMTFVPTSFWTDVYKANGGESIAFGNVNTDGYRMDGNITLADPVMDEEGNTIGWEASRDRVQSYVLWDEGYVYVLFDVNDPDITASTVSHYDCDSVDFFFDQDYSAPDAYDEGNGDEVEFRVDAANNAFSSNEAGTAKYDLVAHAVAYKKGENDYADSYDAEGVTGYQVEMIIKLQNDDYHNTPADGDIMGMDLLVNDCYNRVQYEDREDEFGEPILVPVEGSGTIERAGIITAFDKTFNCYQYPSCFGRVKLFGGRQGGDDNPGGDEGPKAGVEARYTDKAITIDGELDAAWSAAPWLNVANAVPGGEDKNETAKTKLLWDADNLYVLVAVKDADIDVSSYNDWERDGVEVYLDEDNSKEYTYDENTDAFQYRFTGLSEDERDAATHRITAGSITAREAYADIESAYKVVTGGYIIEHKIPWAGAVKEGIRKVGFELKGLDCAAGAINRELYLINTADNPEARMLWCDPSQMGTLKLVGEPVKVSIAESNIAASTAGDPTYKSGSATAKFTTTYGGTGINFWLNKDKSALDLSKYSKVRIKLSSDVAGSNMAFKFTTDPMGGYWHYTPLKDVLKFDDDALYYLIDEAGVVKTVEIDLSKISEENGVLDNEGNAIEGGKFDASAYTVGIQYSRDNEVEEANITIQSIELIEK